MLQDTELEDGIEQKRTLVYKPSSVCAPFDFAGAGVRAPDTVLSWYQVKDAPGQARFSRHELTVSNDFGEFQSIVLKKPVELCLQARVLPYFAPFGLGR